MPWTICANVCTNCSLGLHQLMIPANQNYRNFATVITIQTYDKNRLTSKSILTWRNYISPLLATMALTLGACSSSNDPDIPEPIPTPTPEPEPEPEQWRRYRLGS